MNPTLMHGSQIRDIFCQLLTNLTEKERSVLVRRLGIEGERETLQMIGDTYSITRERVRQIEDVGIKKIGRIMKGTPLGRIQEVGEQILRVSGGLLAKDRLVSAIISELCIDGTVNENIIEVILQSDFTIQKNKPQLGVKTHFFLPEINRKLIQEVHREAIRILTKRGDVMENTLLYEAVRSGLAITYNKIEIGLIDAILDVFTDIVKGEQKYVGLRKWRILNPSTLKDKAIYIMRKEKHPFHFVELTNAISNHFQQPVKVPTIHNELIRNNEFVLIGRGIYVLKEWGYKAGTVLDVIIDILSRDRTPQSTDSIITRVLKVRKVKPSTIYMNLQNKHYVERVGRNLYRLKD